MALRLLARLSSLSVLALIFALGLSRLLPRLGLDLPIAVDWVIFVVRTVEPALGCLFLLLAASCLFLRDGRFAFVALVLGLSVLAGWLLEGGRPSPPKLSGSTLRVQVANLRWANERSWPMKAAIEAIDADVLVFPEWTPFWADALAPILDGFSGAGRPLPLEANGMAIFAKAARAKDEGAVLDFERSGPSYPQSRIEVELDGRRLVVFGLHLLGAHYLGGLELRAPQFQELVSRIRREAHPVILAGDFNFTGRAPHAAELRAIGFREVRDVCGAGRQPTWPSAGRGGPLDERPWLARLLPPILRIDGLYLSSELGCSVARTRAIEGSDHLSVVAEIGFVSGEGRGGPPLSGRAGELPKRDR